MKALFATVFAAALAVMALWVNAAPQVSSAVVSADIPSPLSADEDKDKDKDKEKDKDKKSD